ncbi:related to D-mandelate dehydrogenase [Phialocephala subalpina]|uniref:Related to D-mandelate dehydrogenase n=1 Tax=Phialocephala subalpina TaxID=576137 RepID=A0A1L7WGD9_9HELO|nr:related to D-mandelate dehydrogenase [Phialocephala subalpina]
MGSDIINIDGIRYISGTTIVGSTTQSPCFELSSAARVPVIVLNAVGQSPTEHLWLERRIMELESKDDVINTIFTKRVIVMVSGIEDEDIKQQFTPSEVYIEYPDITQDFYNASLRDGPYFLDGCNLYKAYRLYNDPYNAFVSGVQQPDGEPFIYKEMPQIKSKIVIPVPSRHYFPPPYEQKPLSGKRIAVKDIYDLWGLPTAAGCTQYAVHKGFAFDNAECIKTLLSLGAVIVAKAKTVQFASGMASADWSADTCPTNPRGDGQLDTDCSSSGSAAAIAGYEWLDFTVGSDSLGSMTGPAAACGVFGLRPSFGMLSNVGAVPVSPVLDTPGHFSRSISELSSMAKAWLKPIDKASRIPAALRERWTVVRILTPTDWEPFHIPSKVSAMKEFVQDLEAYWKVAHTPFSIDKCWNNDPGCPSRDSSLSKYLYRTVADIQLHDCWQNASRFLGEYSEEQQGKLEVDKLIQYKWDIGQSVTDDDYKTALERKEIFQKFLERRVFTEGTIMVLPGGSLDIRFRDEKTPEDQYDKWQGFGFQNTTYSVLGGLPAINVPVGHRQYRSKLTGETTMVNQPVSVMVLGPRGSDIWLVHHLEKALRKDRRSVLVGSDAFEVSDYGEQAPKFKESFADLKLRAGAWSSGGCSGVIDS